MISEIRSLEPNIGHTIEGTDFLDSWLADHVWREKLSFIHTVKWFTRRRVKDLPDDALIGASVAAYREIALITVRGYLAFVSLDLSDDECVSTVYGVRFSSGDFEAVVAQLKLWLKPKSERRRGWVQIGFRHNSGDYRGLHLRSIQAPSWPQIRDNYPQRVRPDLDYLLKEFRPAAGGNLILFHGPPGTGKTYVIRALARAWRRWCEVEYLTDPETFFGDASYMTRNLLKEKRGWRLLVLEDAGELLARDAKARQGQGLSRLLNMSDGLIGQGLKVMTLISTNEDIQTLNEAVSRPGRTAAIAEFTAMSVDESNTWLANHGAEVTVARPMTLAELFALISGTRHQAQQTERQIGFVRER